MNPSLYVIANILLLFLLVMVVVRFFWLYFFNNLWKPLQWREAVRKKKVAPGLRKLIRQYPDQSRAMGWWLQVERLKRQKIAGDFAELGVFRGQGAALLHRMDPERTLHLFDTFDGFREEDLKQETGKPASYTPGHFANTSVDQVMRRIKDPEKIRIYMGNVPDTFKEVDEGVRFALVSLDVDLYRPTLSGLSYFYPRLVPGGVLFIHDYNGLWPGVMRAVDEFLATIPEAVVLLPDRDGTVVIVKNSHEPESTKMTNSVPEV